MSEREEITVRFDLVDGAWRPSDISDLDNDGVMLAVYELTRSQLSKASADSVSPEITQQLEGLEQQMEAFPGIRTYEVTSIVDNPDFKSVTVAKRA